MSANTGYFPGSDTEQVIWLNNFLAKLKSLAAQLGVTAAEVNNVAAYAAMFSYTMNVIESHKSTLSNLYAYKRLLKKAKDQQHLGAFPQMTPLPAAPPAVAEGIFDQVALLVRRIKASTAYTESIGCDLGVIAPDNKPDWETLQPELKVKLDAGHPVIKVNKGIADAIDLFVDPNDGRGWVLLSQLIRPSYTDTTTLADGVKIANWDYRAMFVIGNENVGLMSATVGIVVKGA